MQTLHIQLLGDFRLLYNDEPVNMAHLARQQSLLAYLVLHRDAPQSRQQLAFLFWPDTSEVQARSNLRKALFELRRLLPSLDHFVQIEDKSLQWRSATATTLDVEQFTASLTRAAQARQGEVAQAALEQAVTLYRGDLLPACYDDWLLPERERLHQEYVKTLEQLIGLLEQRRELASALAYAQRLLLYDSLHESTYRRLMRLHVLNGDRATALRIYHTCVTLLQQELGVEPSPETHQLYQRLLLVPTDSTVHPPPKWHAPKGQLALVGRQSQWQTLHAAWQRAAAGTAHCVVIAGEAGIGKTRLAEELLHWADRQGYATAHTRSYAAEGRLAYAPITEWLRSPAIRARLPELEPVWLVEVARLLPELLVARPELSPPAPLADSWQRQRFREALARAVTLAHQPLLLVIDDLQWCDNETLEWIHYLLRFAAQQPLLLVGTMRSEEAQDNPTLTTLLANLRHADQLTDIELGLLSSAETATLASQITDDAFSHEQSVALYAQTEGHPLFIVEMLRATEKQGTDSEQVAMHESVALPPKVQAVIHSRLAQLSPPAYDLVSLAATVGRAFTLDVLARASDSDEDTLVRALDELWQRKLIREQGERDYDFSHDRIREVASASVSSARRRLLHRRIAEALASVYANELDTVAAQLAAHYEQAGLLEEAVHWRFQAAQVQQRLHAHSGAVEHFNAGLALLARLPTSVERKQQTVSFLLALESSLRIVRGWTATEREQVMNQARELLREVGDRRQLFQVLQSLSNFHVARRGLLVAHDLNPELLQIAQELDDRTLLMEAYKNDGWVHLHLGEFVWASEQHQQAIELFTSGRPLDLANPPPDPFMDGWAFFAYQALLLWVLGYPQQAQAYDTLALQYAEQHGSPFDVSNALYLNSLLFRELRDVATLQRLAEAMATVRARAELPTTNQLHGSTCQGWILAQQGAFEEAIVRLIPHIEYTRSTGHTMFQTDRLGILAAVYLQAGQLAQAEAILDEALSLSAHFHERWYDAELYRVHGDLMLAQGDAAHAERDYQRAFDVARQQQAKSLELRAAMSLCRLWQRQGRTQEAHLLLAGIYGWFTEGFSTLDHVEARALLDELS